MSKFEEFKAALAAKGLHLSEFEGPSQIQQIYDVVSQLNEELAELVFNDCITPLEIRTTGFATCVDFLGDQLWNSEDDERIYFENTDTYEPYEACFRRLIDERVAHLGAVLPLSNRYMLRNEKAIATLTELALRDGGPGWQEAKKLLLPDIQLALSHLKQP